MKLVKRYGVAVVCIIVTLIAIISSFKQGTESTLILVFLPE